MNKILNSYKNFLEEQKIEPKIIKIRIKDIATFLKKNYGKLTNRILIEHREDVLKKKSKKIANRIISSLNGFTSFINDTFAGNNKEIAIKELMYF